MVWITVANLLNIKEEQGQIVSLDAKRHLLACTYTAACLQPF